MRSCLKQKYLDALNALSEDCKNLLASHFGGKFEDALKLAGETEFIDINSERAATDGPSGAGGRTYRDVWKENLILLGGAISAAAVPMTTQVVSPRGQVSYLYDYRRENTVLFDPNFFRPNSPSQAATLAHEFFHIAYNKGDEDLAKDLGLDPSKFDGPTSQAKASQAISAFIDNKCKK